MSMHISRRQIIVMHTQTRLCRQHRSHVHLHPSLVHSVSSSPPSLSYAILPVPLSDTAVTVNFCVDAVRHCSPYSNVFSNIGRRSLRAEERRQHRQLSPHNLRSLIPSMSLMLLWHC